MFKSLQKQAIRADENMDSFYSKRGKKNIFKKLYYVFKCKKQMVSDSQFYFYNIPLSRANVNIVITSERSRLMLFS